MSIVSSTSGALAGSGFELTGVSSTCGLDSSVGGGVACFSSIGFSSSLCGWNFEVEWFVFEFCRDDCDDDFIF